MRLFSGTSAYQPVWHPYVTNRWEAKLIRETLPALLSLVQFCLLRNSDLEPEPGRDYAVYVYNIRQERAQAFGGIKSGMKFISKPFSEEVRVVRGICFVLRICMSRSWSSRPLESLFDACLSDLRSVESLWSIRQIHFHEQGWSVIARLALLLFFGWSLSSLCRRYRLPDVLQKEMEQLIIIASALMFFL